MLQRQLAIATLLVVAAHALLLLGLPRLRQASELSIDTGTFTTRRIAAPAVPVAPTPSAEPKAPVPPAPKPEPVAAPIKPSPAPPVHKPRARTAPPPKPATATTAGLPGLAGATTPSLLNPKPTGMGDFGGGALPKPITPPLAADATGPALELAQSLGDTPVHIPRAAELTFQAQGTIGGQAFTVPVTLQWRQDGQWFESRFGFYNPKVGAHTRQVTGLITPQGLLPTLAQIRSLNDDQEIRFDYDRKVVAFSASGTDAPLPAGMQDRLSVLLQLGALLAGDPERYPVGTAISLPAAHARGVGTWRFAVEADEDLPALRDKIVPTVHLAHIPFDNQSARIEVWLGRTLDYLPVRLRTTEPNGDTVEYQLISAYAQPTPTTDSARAGAAKPAS